MKHYIIIVISAISLGIANAFYKKSTAAIGAFNTTFYYYLFGTIFSLIIWYFKRETGKIEISQLIYPAIIAFFLSLSIFAFTVGLSKTKLSISSTIRSFSFVVSIFVAVVFMKETLSIKQIIGLVLAAVSVFLLVS